MGMKAKAPAATKMDLRLMYYLYGGSFQRGLSSRSTEVPFQQPPYTLMQWQVDPPKFYRNNTNVVMATHTATYGEMPLVGQA